jgi:hypothetical protein
MVNIIRVICLKRLFFLCKIGLLIFIKQSFVICVKKQENIKVAKYTLIVKPSI